MSKYFDTKPGSLEEFTYPLLNRMQSLSPKRRKVRNQRKENNFIYSNVRWQRRMVKRLLQLVTKNTK